MQKSNIQMTRNSTSQNIVKVVAVVGCMVASSTKRLLLLPSNKISFNGHKAHKCLAEARHNFLPQMGD